MLVMAKKRSQQEKWTSWSRAGNIHGIHNINNLLYSVLPECDESVHLVL